MSTTLNVAVIQAHLAWENPAQNKKQFESLFKTIDQGIDVIFLPEMFTTGFTMSPKNVAETMDGSTVNWMQEWSQKLNAAIGGSLIIKDGNCFYNRFVFVTPDGTLRTYDKRHRFMMAGEGESYTAGSQQVIIHYKGWKILPQICYDLRFPVFSRNTQDYDIVVYVANWPKTRIAAWDTLLKARAIENMSYSIGVNRIGADGNNLEYIGHSGVYDLLGNTVAFGNENEGVITAILSKEIITSTRSQLPFLNDRDHFNIKL